MLKIAKVTPLFKSGDAENVTNYRSFSVLPLLSKALDRITYNQIYKHQKNHNLSFLREFGFQLNNFIEYTIP